MPATATPTTVPGTSATASPSAVAATGSRRPEPLDRVAPVARSVARVATETPQLPLLMLAVVALFLGLQSRIDRRDPKLRQLATAQPAELEFGPPRRGRAVRTAPRRQVPLRVRQVDDGFAPTSVVLPEPDQEL